MELPSKKLFYFFIPVIIGLGIFVTFKTSLDNKNISANNTPKILSSTNSDGTQYPELDSDNDGLKDWEEVLWGLDPHNPTSNGHGMTDGEWVARLKNASSTIAIFSSNFLAGTSTKETATDKISKKIFTDYLALKQSGTINTQYIMDVGANAANDIYSLKAKDPYTVINLNILPSATTPANLAIYANTLLSIVQKMNSQQVVADASVIMNKIDSPEFASTMTAVSKLYISLSKSTLKIPTPTELADTHLLLVNSFARTGQEFANISGASSDPALAVAAIKNIKSNKTEQKQYLDSIDSYLTSHGLIFITTSNEYAVKPK